MGWTMGRAMTSAARPASGCSRSSAARRARRDSRLFADLLAGASRPGPLDHHPIRNGGVLEDDYNAIADHEAQVFLVGLLHVGVVHNPDMAPDAGVFVHNSFANRRVGPHTQRNDPLFRSEEHTSELQSLRHLV